MKRDGQTFYSELEREVAEKLTKQGYSVIANPREDQLPFQLQQYQPDLLATRSDDNLVVEVKGTANKLSVDRYRDIAAEVAEHPGWRFVLVTGSDVDRLDGGLLPSLSEIRDKLKRARELANSGSTEAALLTMWASFEAGMRRQAQTTGLLSERFPTSTLLRQLYSNGELSMDQYDRAQKLFDARNRVAHGFEISDSESAIEQLGGLAEEVLGEWSES